MERRRFSDFLAGAAAAAFFFMDLRLVAVSKETPCAIKALGWEIWENRFDAPWPCQKS